MGFFDDAINRLLSENTFPLEDIKLATNNFSPENVITVNGDETVYKGEIIRGGKPLTVRVKRFEELIDASDMDLAVKNMAPLFLIKDPNIMSLLGFCSEDDKLILVLEYPAYGSLHNYLDNTNLTWKIRLKICVGAARAISFLHGSSNTDQINYLFGDFTSSSIFLDTNWEAKVSYIEYYYNHTDSVYSDPVLKKTGTKTKESDIYSLGIVLFEVLCGRLAFDTEYDSDSHYLMKLVEQSYKEGKLDEIIDPFLKNQMAPDSLSTFSNIAYQCCNKNREQCPRVEHILQELEQAVALCWKYKD